VALDGVAITGADDLIRVLAGDKIGRAVELDVLRFGKPRRLTVTAQERPRP
jgi:S1-C subfamily serine protease